MDECKHVWQGDADGVTCRLCKKHFTVEEYVKYLHTPETKPKGKKVKANE